MISPSSGVNPIDVSTDSPPLTAVTLAPFPKWHTMIFKSLISFPKTFAVSKDTTDEMFRGIHNGGYHLHRSIF